MGRLERSPNIVVPIEAGTGEHDAGDEIEVEVIVRDLVIDANVGIHDHEIGHPQPIQITVRLTVDLPRSDGIDATVDYRRIEEFATRLAGRHTALIETFAADLARTCLSIDFVQKVDVLISKPRALSSGLAQARVLLRRHRSD